MFMPSILVNKARPKPLDLYSGVRFLLDVLDKHTLKQHHRQQGLRILQDRHLPGARPPSL